MLGSAIIQEVEEANKLVRVRRQALRSFLKEWKRFWLVKVWSKEWPHGMGDVVERIP